MMGIEVVAFLLQPRRNRLRRSPRHRAWRDPRRAGEPVILIFRPAIFDSDIATFLIASISQDLVERPCHRLTLELRAELRKVRQCRCRYRWAKNQYDRLPPSPWISPRAVSRRSVGRRWRLGCSQEEATTSNPIIFTGTRSGSAPMVQEHQSARGQSTGVTFYSGGAIIAKQLECYVSWSRTLPKCDARPSQIALRLSRRCRMPLCGASERRGASYRERRRCVGSRRRLHPIQANALVSWSIPSSTVSPPKLSRARRVGTYRPCTTFVNSWRQAGSSATVRASSRLS